MEILEGIAFAVPSGSVEDNCGSRRLYSEIPGLGCACGCKPGGQEIDLQHLKGSFLF